MNNDLSTSPGAWYVRPTISSVSNHLTIASDTGDIIATVPPRNGRPNLGDAALLASAKDMLDALIEIQEIAYGTGDVELIKAALSQAVEKIYNEAEGS